MPGSLGLGGVIPVYLSISSSLSIYLSIYLSLRVYLSIYLSIHLSIYLCNIYTAPGSLCLGDAAGEVGQALPLRLRLRLEPLHPTPGHTRPPPLPRRGHKA